MIHINKIFFEFWEKTFMVFWDFWEWLILIFDVDELDKYHRLIMKMEI